MCDACHRRAAWLETGGSWNDDDFEWDEDEEPGYRDLHASLAEAGDESIAWRWRWRTRGELDNR